MYIIIVGVCLLISYNRYMCTLIIKLLNLRASLRERNMQFTVIAPRPNAFPHCALWPYNMIIYMCVCVYCSFARSTSMLTSYSIRSCLSRSIYSNRKQRSAMIYYSVQLLGGIRLLFFFVPSPLNIELHDRKLVWNVHSAKKHPLNTFYGSRGLNNA